VLFSLQHHTRALLHAVYEVKCTTLMIPPHPPPHTHLEACLARHVEQQQLDLVKGGGCDWQQVIAQ
jgi:hypothetical protein